MLHPLNHSIIKLSLKEKIKYLKQKSFTNAEFLRNFLSDTSQFLEWSEWVNAKFYYYYYSLLVFLKRYKISCKNNVYNFIQWE